ncbi:DUF4123 domain-containing protein [Massilia timonae]|uniref:DUF4123 domain-containing protein n=1 Tax=Massilia timonae TaxID=47229 RepID=UPI0028A1745E|nr:DUF4123 domain-containing protein [Massilia timonae]
MSASNGELFVYLLIDNGLLQDVSAGYAEADAKSRPVWLEPVYAERALEVSPLLIDVEVAYEAGDIEKVMGYVSAGRPALHASIIECNLKLGELAHHLRRFIFIVDPNGKQFTLRYADCAVLAPLSSLLTPPQWGAMRGPITRWVVHDRSGSMIQLPPIESDARAPTPFCLDWEQLAALDDASEPDHFIAKAKMMRHGGDFPGNAVEQHAWARGAREVWRAVGNSNPLFLTLLTETALVTRGSIINREEVRNCLALIDIDTFAAQLKELVARTRGH